MLNWKKLRVKSKIVYNRGKALQVLIIDYHKAGLIKVLKCPLSFRSLCFFVNATFMYYVHIIHSHFTLTNVFKQIKEN